jgi:hypothetical protein
MPVITDSLVSIPNRQSAPRLQPHDAAPHVTPALTSPVGLTSARMAGRLPANPSTAPRMPLPPGAAISAVAGPQAAAADDGHGAVVVDVDEAVHGVYAAVQYVKEGAKEGPAAVWSQFQDEARHWHDAPLGVLSQ